jgi:sugar phosphate permease
VAAASDARAQASSLYYLAYYAGSSVFGWLLGWVFGGAGWGVFLAAVLAMCALALTVAMLTLRASSASGR